MKRTTITLPEETVKAVERAARKRRKSVSATIRELIENQLEAEQAVSPFEAMIGIVSDPNLPHGADIEEALKESWADAIARDRG